MDSRGAMFVKGHVQYTRQLNYIRKSHHTWHSRVMLRVRCIVRYPAMYRSNNLKPDTYTLLGSNMIAIVEQADYRRSVLSTCVNLASTERDNSVYLLDTIDDIVATTLLDCIG